jgi:hypothetical protein
MIPENLLDILLPQSKRDELKKARGNPQAVQRRGGERSHSGHKCCMYITTSPI